MAAVESAKTVVAVVNSHVPRVHGDGFVHVSRIDIMLRHDAPLGEYAFRAADASTADAIGRNVAGLIDDGACLQVGIGSLQYVIGHDPPCVMPAHVLWSA